jgi:hypothetical protein
LKLKWEWLFSFSQNKNLAMKFLQKSPVKPAFQRCMRNSLPLHPEMHEKLPALSRDVSEY